MLSQNVVVMLRCFIVLIGFMAGPLLAEDLTVVEQGAQTFAQNCVACHDVDGTGRHTEAMDRQPADLTRIKSRNEGVFPMAKIYAVIDGRDESHAQQERIMPVWRDRFLEESVWEGCSQIEDTIVHGRIMQLLMYLESIQR